MHHHTPPGTIAPHIPAADWQRAQATGQPIVIVHTTPPPARRARAFLFPLAVAGAGAVGVLGLVAAFLALLDFAAHTAAAIATAAGPIGVGGIALKLARPKK